MFKATPLNETIHIDSLYTLHCFDYTKDFTFIGERHNFWELVYVDSGEVGLMSENTGYHLKQGEAFFHKPNEYHNIWADRKFACVIVITFGAESNAMKFFEGKIIQVNESQKQHISEILKEGLQAFAEPLDILDQKRLILSPDAPFGCEQLIKTHLEQLIIEMIRTNTTLKKDSRISESAKRHNEDLIVEKIVEILLENLTSRVTLDEISQQIGFSKSYVKTLFKRSTGMSVMQMYTKMKIDRAKKLISEQRYFMTEISEMLGFNSVHYFSRTFKKITGMSPSSYSQSVRKKALL